jgi:hypothetical protein
VVVGSLLASGGCGNRSTERVEAATTNAEAPSPVALPVIVTVVPPEGTADPRPEPAARYPEGSRLVRLDDVSPEANPVVLTDGLFAAGGATVSRDGESLLFVAKESRGDAYGVWSCRLDGSERRRVVAHDGDCGAAAYLPDGRIVYAGATGEASPLPALRASWALFVADGDGGTGRRITFSAGLDLDPTVLKDGRILYAAWMPSGDGDAPGGRFALFTAHPDGTGAARFNGDGPRWASRPTQHRDGSVTFVGGETLPADSVYVLDWRSPFSEPSRLGPGDVIASFEPATDDGARWVRLDADRSSGSVVRLGEEGRPGGRGWTPDRGWIAVHAIEAAPRPRAQGHLSMMRPETPRGSLLCMDARPPGETTATRARITALDGPFRGGRRPAGRVLGEVPLAEDGSFFVAVPPDVPLVLDLVDDEGNVVAPTATPFWVRPNEVRGCVGCHEDPTTAPANRRPLAVLEDAVPLGVPAREGGR